MHSQRTGLCECGCGGRTSLARYTRSAARGGQKKGQPLRFLPGHQHLAPGPAYIEEDRGYITPCWIWQRTKTGNGYAQRYATRHLGNTRYVHVQNYVERHGSVPAGLDLDHLCRNRACVNPDHLEPVSHAVNIQRGKGTKLNTATAGEVKALAHAGWHPCDIAAAYGISTSLVDGIKAGNRWATA